MAGATGVIGQPSVQGLVAAGHDVIGVAPTPQGVARTPEKETLLLGLGAIPISLDLFDREAVRDAVRGCEAVVNLATIRNTDWPYWLSDLEEKKSA